MSKKTIIILASVILFLIVLHLALPPLIKWYINSNFEDVNGIQVSVRDVDLKLWRGAYEVEGFTAKELAVAADVPLVYCGSFHFTLDWGALFHGMIVSDINMDTLKINFVNRPDSLVASSDTARMDFAATMADLVPIDINELTIKNGYVSYKDFQSSPNVDIALADLNVEAHNLSNVVDENTPLPAEIHAWANTLGEGRLDMEANVNVMRSIPDLTLSLKLEKASLVELNDFFLAYGKFDFQQGRMSIYSEMSVSDETVDGYVKAVLDSMDISTEAEREEQSVFQKTYERLVEGTTEVLSVKENKLATKIPIEGRLETAGVEMLPALFTLFRNAWMEGLQNQVDQTIALGDAQARAISNDGGGLFKREED